MSVLLFLNWSGKRLRYLIIILSIAILALALIGLDEYVNRGMPVYSRLKLSQHASVSSAVCSSLKAKWPDANCSDITQASTDSAAIPELSDMLWGTFEKYVFISIGRPTHFQKIDGRRRHIIYPIIGYINDVHPNDGSTVNLSPRGEGYISIEFTAIEKGVLVSRIIVHEIEGHRSEWVPSEPLKIMEK